MPTPLIVTVIGRDLASKTFDRIGKRAEDLAKRTKSANDRFSGAGTAAAVSAKAMRGMAVASVGVAAGVGIAISKAAAFDKTIRKVGAISNVSGTELQSLSKLAIKMGNDTVFSAQEAAGAMLELSKSGFSSAQIKAGALQSTLTLATAGELSMADAATYLGNQLNTFGLKAEESGRVVAALAGGANASSASVESLGIALSQVGPSAKLVGSSVEETVAVLAAFDNAGVKGSDAGTSLKTMLLRLNPATKQAANEMKRLGLDFTDASGNFLPMRDVAEQLKTKLGNLTAEQKSAALQTIFGADAYRASAIMASLGAAGVDKYTKATSDLGAAEKLAKVGTEGAAGAIEQFKGSIDTLAVVFATHLLPAFTKVTQGATTLINGIGTTVIPGVKALGAALKGDGVTSDGFVGAMERIGVAVRGFAQSAGVQTAINLIKGSFADLASFVTGSVVPSLRNLGTFFAPLIPILQSVGKAIAGAFLVALRAIAAVLANVIGPALNAVTGFMAENRTAVMSLAIVIGSLVVVTKGAALATVAFAKAQALVTTVVNIAKGAMLSFRIAILLVGHAFKTNPIGFVVTVLIALAAGLVYAYKHSEKFRKIVDAAFKGVKAAAMAVWNFIKSNWQKLVVMLFGPFGLAVVMIVRHFDTIKGAALAVWRFLVNAWKGLTDALSGPVQDAVSFIVSAWNGIRTAFTVTIAVIKSVWSTVTSALAGPVTTAIGMIVAAFGVIKTAITVAIAVIKGVWSVVKVVLLVPVAIAVGSIVLAFRAIVFGIKVAIAAIKVAWAVIRTVLEPPVKLAIAIIKGYWGLLSAGVKLAIDAIRVVWAGIRTAMEPPVKVAVEAIKVLWKGMQAAFDTVKKAIETGCGAIKAAFGVVQDGAKFMWNSVLRPTFKFLADAWFTVVGAIVNGAARAFGWVPGVGDKLKSAANEFNTFRSQVNAALDGIQDENVNVGTKIMVNGQVATITRAGLKVAGGTIPIAQGAVFDKVSAFANGGMSERHVAQIAPPGAMRLWAEPETGGEAYIPLAQAKRGRSTKILDAVAKRFGYDLMPFAKGGITIDAKADSAPMRGAAKVVSASNKSIASVMKKAASGMLSRVQAWAKKLFDSFGGGSGGGKVNPGLAPALKWARSQAGKPYLWGGVGPRGYDCSGFMSAIINRIKGRNPHRRLFATGSMPAGGLSTGALNSAFRVGWFRGSPGHTAGTLNGVNVESRGGRGVVVGSGARGWSNKMFNRRAGLKGYARGGIDGDAAFDLLNPRGKKYLGHKAAEIYASTFDRGGWLKPGLTLAHNGTGRRERVMPPESSSRTRRVEPSKSNIDARELRRALEGMTLVVDDRGRGRFTARTADLYGRAG